MLWVPEPRRENPRGTSSHRSISALWIHHDLLFKSAKWNAVRNNHKLFFSFPFPLFFLSNKPKLFSLPFYFPFHDPFHFLYFTKNLFFPLHSILFSFPIPTSLYFIQTQILFLSISHFLTFLILISYFLSFFLFLILTWYFLFPLTFCCFRETIFPFSVSVFRSNFHFPFSSNQPKWFSLSFHFPFN